MYIGTPRKCESLGISRCVRRSTLQTLSIAKISRLVNDIANEIKSLIRSRSKSVCLLCVFLCSWRCVKLSGPRMLQESWPQTSCRVVMRNVLSRAASCVCRPTRTNISSFMDHGAVVVRFSVCECIRLLSMKYFFLFCAMVKCRCECHEMNVI